MKRRAKEAMRCAAALALGLSFYACGSKQPAPGAAAAPAAEAPKTVVAASPPKKRGKLREDPVAGLKSTLQWKEHLAHEDEERQVMFDKPRLQQHRAVIELIVAARARYDRARTQVALDKARAQMPEQHAEIRKRITELDHWGNNSRLHPDYDALLAALSASYPDAKAAQLQGQSEAFATARADADKHLENMNEWLEHVEHEALEGEGGEGNEARERGQERERNNERESARPAREAGLRPGAPARDEREREAERREPAEQPRSTVRPD